MAERTLTEYSGLLVKVALAVAFIYAGSIKVLEPTAFLGDILNYHMASYQQSLLISLMLPWLEILCAISLFIERYKRAALILMTIMMLVFMAALLSAWYRDLDISCGCFGHSEGGQSYWLWLSRDIVFILAIVYVSLFDKVLNIKSEK